MKIDLYHLHRHLHFTNFAYPIILDVLKVWAESVGWEARVLLCKESGVDLASNAEVIGISVYTMTAPAAYRICEKLRQRGKTVILGGPHFRGPTTQLEASSHCDVLVSSICEKQWKNLLRNIASGKIIPNRLGAMHIVDKKKEFRYPDNFYETSKSRKWYQISSVPTSIGCPYSCNFCSPYLHGQYILRDIQTIFNEAAHVPGKALFLCDATFGLNKTFTIELMKRLAPLKKKILVETTLSRLRDDDMLETLARGGVKWIIVGIETLNLKLKKHGAGDLEEVVKHLVDRVHANNMLIQGNLICGFDCDGPDSFDRMRQFYENSNLDSVMIDLLIPYPNTELYDKFLREGRILDTNWEHYDYHHLVYEPLRMSPEQLVNGFIQLYRSISNRRSIISAALHVYEEKGLNLESAALIGYHLYNRFDAKRKERALRQNQIQGTNGPLTVQ
jgi:radical SAM superfamily enzyme YgiQ (UPF0313 family)